MIAVAEKTEEPATEDWHEGFLQMLPRIERQARAAFSDMDAEAQEDAVSEVVANALCAYERLYQRDELERAFASALTRFAIAQFYDGRRVGTPQCSHDVYFPQAKRKGDYEMLSLGAPGEQVGEWIECLHDNRYTPVPEQVAFRLDFPRWLDTHSDRDKQIAERLSIGTSTSEVAKEFKISQARVSQLRRELADSWYKFICAALDQDEDDKLTEE